MNEILKMLDERIAFLEDGVKELDEYVHRKDTSIREKMVPYEVSACYKLDIEFLKSLREKLA